MLMQYTQQQIFYGVTAISCAYLLYSIAKQKTSKKRKNKKQLNKTHDYTFGSKSWLISYFDRNTSAIDNSNFKNKTNDQGIELESKKQKQINKNVYQVSSKEAEMPLIEQPNHFIENLNQISDEEDQLFFKLGLRLLNGVQS
ncbi:unnamed protein product (macronuclear) [Paramecium tetraurelia]|uniref:Transmembrane protein n=1 Tax=Paramecium tetraurelia TaxID=5888 RepID=A0DIS8_PARTE|nr:uncharacterized protein GSPATT00017302001 [Paramecium tetraurelia]CAK82945.1 unnamed protein product [Paramecium tetraurelia]|eukprot:XP_001450342.1 hypothetical protein (macronuclear) [Paramecium tetraurelia strain d4-2]